MAAEPKMPSIAMVEVDHKAWIECPVCNALNFEDDTECCICKSKLPHQM